MTEHIGSQGANGQAASVISRMQEDDDSLRGSIVYCSGLRQAGSDAGLPVVCCLVRDGAYWLPAFLDHYRAMGVEEFFFLDNGSVDGSLDLLCGQDGVGVYAIESAYFKHFNAHLRRILIERVRPRGWTIGVDIDEFFDYPHSQDVSLTQLCAYLDRFDYDSMSTHQLDMFSDKPLNAAGDSDDADPRRAYRYYSLAGLRSNNYQCAQDIADGLLALDLRLPGKDWKFYYNGVRFKKFGVDIWLTKHALFKTGGSLLPFHHPHLHRNMTVADISGVLYHYKFTPCFVQQVRNALSERQYCDNSSDYEFYQRGLDKPGSLILADGSSRRLDAVNQLLNESFVSAPEDFVALARND